MRIKKYTMILLAILTIVILFSGCSAHETEPPTVPQGTVKPPWTDLPGDNMPDLPKTAPAE